MNVQGIIEDLVNLPGGTKGIESNALRRLWQGLCQQVHEALYAKRSIVIPDFGQFTYQRHTLDIGTLGTRTSFHPLFLFHPSYAQQYSLSPKQKERTPVVGNNGPMSSAVVNYVTLGMASGLSRHSVGTALRELTRRIGQFAFQGSSLSLDFGPAVVHINGQRYWATWTPAYMQVLKAADTKGAAPQDPRLTAQPAQTAPRNPPADERPGTTASKASSKIRAVAAVQEARESSQVGAKAFGAAGSAHPQDNGAIDLQDLPEHLDVKGTSAQLRDADNAFQRHKQAKALHRLARKAKDSPQEVWDSQLQERQRQQQAQRDAEAAYRKQMLERIQREEETEKARREQNRQQAQVVNKENVQYATKRDQTVGAHEMGAYFRTQTSPPVASDLQFLQKQMATKKDARALEKAKEIETDLKCSAEYKERLLIRELAEKQQKREKDKAFQAGLESQKQAMTTMKEQQKETPEVGDFFFGQLSPEEQLEKEKRRRMEKSTRNKTFWEGSLQIHQATMQQRQQSKEEEKAEDLKRIEKAKQELQARKEKKVEAKKQTKEQLFAAWSQQQEERKQNTLQNPRVADSWFQQQQRWKNDSSDTEAVP